MGQWKYKLKMGLQALGKSKDSQCIATDPAEVAHFGRGNRQRIVAPLERMSMPVYDFLREDLTKLRTVLVSVRDGIDSEDENLEFYRSGDQADRAALWSKPFLQDDQITFYDNVPWFAGKTWDQLPAESFNQLLFHELTHIYGTEDDDSEGPLHNAHTIQKMITGTLKGSPIYYGLLKDAKANCGGRCERDLINSDNWFWYIFP